MQTASASIEPQFAGSDDDQQLAREVFQAMSAIGRFLPVTAPIRVPLESIADFFVSQQQGRSAEDWAGEIERVLAQNPDVWVREEQDGNIFYITTRSGRAPQIEPDEDTSHTLARRFMEPVPLPEEPEDAEVQAPTAEVPVEAPPPAELAPAEVPTGEPELEEEPSPAPVVPPARTAQPELVTDLSKLDPAELAETISEQLRQNLSVANFGDLWMAEDKVPRLSRGDLRRIREYLLERNEPLTDETLLQDALNTRPGSENYDLMRFAVNYRLSREQRDFDFVGTSDQRLWSTSDLPSIGTTKRKASEIGQDYRFLLDYHWEIAERDEPVVEHVLTFYEYYYGILPLDARFEALLPPPMLPDQRIAVLSFESPQTYETFHIELRYPTGNRGGYLAGLEGFFSENLVPGALITVERTENNGQYLIGYLPVSGQDRKLLQIDDKKGRYVFRPTTFYCATQENMVLSENRYPRLANAPVLEDRAKRRPELALAAAFERVGEREDIDGATRYMAILDDLIAVANIDRPMSGELIRDLVRSEKHPEFSADPDVEDVFYYQPRNDE